MNEELLALTQKFIDLYESADQYTVAAAVVIAKELIWLKRSQRDANPSESAEVA